MKRSEFICKNCLCRIDADRDDVVKDLCILLPDWKPVTPRHFCGSGKWCGEAVSALSESLFGVQAAKLATILTWGMWDDEL